MKTSEWPLEVARAKRRVIYRKKRPKRDEGKTEAMEAIKGLETEQRRRHRNGERLQKMREEGVKAQPWRESNRDEGGRDKGQRKNGSKGPGRNRNPGGGPATREGCGEE
jgi:hypothetical protein